MKILLALLFFAGFRALAQEGITPDSDIRDSTNLINSDEIPAAVNDESREPAAVGVQTSPKTQVDQDELRVQSQLPEAQVKRDTRSMQSEVFKTMFNKDLKPDQREDALEE